MRLFRRIHSFLTQETLATLAIHSSDAGQTLIEYGLIVAMVALVTVAGVGAVGYNMKHFFYDQVASKFHS